MKYVSLDIETTGLQHDPNNVLSVALVIEDSDEEKPLEELPALKIIFLHEPKNYSDTAVSMNAKLFAARALLKGHVKPEKLEALVGEQTCKGALDLFAAYKKAESWALAERMIKDFLDDNSIDLTPHMAGKNVGSFDWNFLPATVQQLFSGEFLDPGDMYKRAGDRGRPSMATCSERAGISTFVAHGAYEDALQVIELIRLAPAKANAAPL